MIKHLKPKSEFSRNVLTLMTGTTIAQAIPIAITPILTRLYTPEDFGVLALFIAVTAILGAIVNGCYDLAIMLPEEDEDAINIAALGLLIAICLSLILLIPAIVLNDQITNLLGNQEIGFWLYFVPFVVLMIGLYNVLNYLNNRKKLYKDIAISNVYKSTAMVTAQLGVGFIKSGAAGLISGQIVSQLVANYRLAKNTKANYRLEAIDIKRLSDLAVRYKNFPKFTLWAVLANNLSNHLVSILISAIYSVVTLGFYFLTQKVLGLPANLISSAIGQVFFQEATEEKKKSGTTEVTFKKTLMKLSIYSLIVFFILFWVVEDVFIIVFGEDWDVAGFYAQILTPLFFIRFIVSPLTVMNMIYEKNDIGMYWQIGLLIINIALVLMAIYFELSFEMYLYNVVLFIGFYYLILLYIISRYGSN